MRNLALNHNQYAVAAITVTLCLAGFYTIIDAGLSTTESGGFDAAGSDAVSYTHSPSPRDRQKSRMPSSA